MSIITVVVLLLLPVLLQADVQAEKRFKETHFLTNEFRNHFISSLINDTDNQTDAYVAAIADTDFGTLLNSSFMVTDSTKPFLYSSREYFFSTVVFNETIGNEGNETVPSREWYCTYVIAPIDLELNQLSDENGNKISKIHYTCDSGTECCGLDCCGDDVILNITIVAAISGSLLFLLICNIIIGFNKRRGKKSNHAVVYEAKSADKAADAPEEANLEQVHIRTN